MGRVFKLGQLNCWAYGPSIQIGSTKLCGPMGRVFNLGRLNYSAHGPSSQIGSTKLLGLWAEYSNWTEYCLSPRRR